MKTYSMRRMYGEALADLGARDESVVVLEADLAEATKTSLFQERFPGRFIEVGIAEQNMMSIAAGLALSGKTAFVTGLAVFVVLRACEQLRTSVALARANVKIAGPYGGLCTAENGPTHQCITDLGVARTIPELKVVAPADAEACRALVDAAAECPGPVYMRLLRDDEPLIYDRETASTFTVGGGHRLRRGKDVSLCAHGMMVSECLQAADLLAAEGISASVVDLYSLKPLPRELVLEEAEATDALVTVEEHNIFGGLGSAVAELLARERPAPVKMIGLQDEFAVSGCYADLLDRYGLKGEHIARETAAWLRTLKRR
jgi:transketolase